MTEEEDAMHQSIKRLDDLQRRSNRMREAITVYRSNVTKTVTLQAPLELYSARELHSLALDYHSTLQLLIWNLGKLIRAVPPNGLANKDRTS